VNVTKWAGSQMTMTVTVPGDRVVKTTTAIIRVAAMVMVVAAAGSENQSDIPKLLVVAEAKMAAAITLEAADLKTKVDSRVHAEKTATEDSAKARVMDRVSPKVQDDHAKMRAIIHVDMADPTKMIEATNHVDVNPRIGAMTKGTVHLAPEEDPVVRAGDGTVTQKAIPKLRVAAGKSVVAAQHDTAEKMKAVDGKIAMEFGTPRVKVTALQTGAEEAMKDAAGLVIPKVTPKLPAEAGLIGNKQDAIMTKGAL
jgi:hypothetical protein